jgi:hypothetical protein
VRTARCARDTSACSRSGCRSAACSALCTPRQARVDALAVIGVPLRLRRGSGLPLLRYARWPYMPKPARLRHPRRDRARAPPSLRVMPTASAIELIRCSAACAWRSARSPPAARRARMPRRDRRSRDARRIARVGGRPSASCCGSELGHVAPVDYDGPDCRARGC